MFNFKKHIHQDKGRQIIFAIYFILFLLFSALFLYPLFWCFINSLKSVAEYMEDPSALPSTWNFGYYIETFNSFRVKSHYFWEMTWNSVWLTFGGQFINILASLFVAYPLAKYKFPLRKFFYGIIIFRITIPVIGSSAAGYKLLRTLGFINNPVGFLTTYFTGFDINALIIYGYLKGISKGYSEAAFIDGATRIQTFIKIIVPLVMPCLLALYVNSVMGNWNIYTTTQIYMTDYPNLAYGIFCFESDKLYIPNGTAKFFGAIILSSLVPITLFAVSQKTMLNNMSIGGLKG